MSKKSYVHQKKKNFFLMLLSSLWDIICQWQFLFYNKIKFKKKISVQPSFLLMFKEYTQKVENYENVA